MMTRFELISDQDFFRDQIESYQALFDQCPAATPFQSPEWLRTLYHFRKRGFKVLVGFEGKDLALSLPLKCSNGMWSCWRPFGVGPSDYLGPLYQSTEHVKDLYAFLLEQRETTLVDLHQVPSDHLLSNCFLQGESISQARCLLLDLPNTFDEYVANLSKSLRYDVRRIGGKAFSEKNAEVLWLDDSNRDQFADSFFNLHKLRWKSRGLPGAFIGSGERFQRAWISNRNSAVVMNMLLVEGKPAGVIYGMKQNETMYFYQAGMDPALSSLSPGTVLVAKLIERAISEGCKTFDFMRGDEPYKRRWKPTRERTNYRFLVSNGTVLSQAGKAWNEQAWKIESRIREKVEGKGLLLRREPKPSSGG
jgi:CelD/BcsL family acetyltransferase involved in cellulose biosynthesis